MSARTLSRQGFTRSPDPSHNPGGDEPVPVSKDGYLLLKIDVGLNGQNYEVEQQVHGAARQNLMPLLLYALR